MGTLAVCFGVFCLCIAATPAKPKEASSLVAWAGCLSLLVFVARVLGFILEKWGW